MHHMNGKKVAILVADEFEEVEMTGPCKALQDAGDQTSINPDNQRLSNHWMLRAPT